MAHMGSIRSKTRATGSLKSSVDIFWGYIGIMEKANGSYRDYRRVYIGILLASD